MKGNPSGLIVHRGSRTERLADELARQLEAQRPAHPLAAQTVVVAHPGLQRWLLGRFAQRPGPNGAHGIAANYDMILPWQWFERTARRMLGDEALIGGAYRHEALRWRLLMALPSLTAPEVDNYLSGDDAARRSFQLAEHMAGLYTQYLIYRPEWMLEWERSTARRPRDWQAALWRQVQGTIARPHRAQRSAALLEALREEDASANDWPLHVFGVSHLPPDVLQALQAYALHTPVHVYFPDPCREHWVYLRDRRFLLARQDDPEALYFEVGHPLLVALGRIAQDFCLTLDEAEAIDERDPMDEAEPLPGETSLLAQVQSSIRCMAPELVGKSVREQIDAGSLAKDVLPALRDDASLRVHACHTRLRELEVLKNTLLRSLADDPTLQHRDIVVMAPDISAYAPYLAAVFGEPAQYRVDPLHIPWHLADVGLSRAHPLMSAFAQVLDVAQSRFTVSEVLDFLDVPAVARRFAIDSGSREAVERWLRRSRVAWGLDADMKAQAGGAAVDANSWKFGFDRMYAGWIVGENDDGALLDGILPLDGVSGIAVESVGQLDRLVGELRRARDEFATAKPLSAWSEWLLQLIDALFLADLRDDAENNALDALRRLAASLGTQASEVGMNTSLPWSVVREAVRGALDAVPERQAFLLGGVTFCGLVPQRSIPFRAVCLIGMNEGEFPRPGGDAGLNKILAQPRRGDRDTRSEDRYLFLEAMMSARDILHISFIGEGVRDGKPRNPAAPLAELLQFLDEQHGLAQAGDMPRPWILRHPLQPFDARYYERDAHGQPKHDPRLFSYEPAFLKKNATLASPPFLSNRAEVSEENARKDISLAALHRFWRDPAKDALLRTQGISLESLDQQAWPDREPLEPRVSRIERVEHRLLFDALAAGLDAPPVEPPAWLAQSGMLAGGAIGEEAYTTLRASLGGLLGEARETFSGAVAVPAAQPIDLDLGDGVRLTGVIDRVFRTADGDLLLFDAQPARAAGLKELLSFYIDWSALKLAGHTALRGEYLELASDRRKARRSPLLSPVLAQDVRQLREGLKQLIEIYMAADRQPLLFFPRAAQAYAVAKPDQRLAKAASAWEGDDFNHGGERDFAPGYAALLTRGLDLFDPRSAACAAFIAATERVCHVLDPDRTMLMKSQAGAVNADAGDGE
ncbi:exodeoxyribonuclease V subunit gamma [Rhodanobacter sp. L36]|uniref:exodeoxyribonuclease V subunit gamma n=1 Tax=Rhodanobacter sp. L36 TaxID=1747221 RepID=UPI00131ADD58|nr:exodeoxyribonuclease V subunit gamma [Rhodanobacter sp. L36]